MNTIFFDDVQYPEGLFGGKDFFNPIIYSTEEREIGVWVDGRPLYQKTFITNVTLTSGAWTVTGDSVLNGKAIDAEVTLIGQGNDTIPVWCEIGADGHIELLNIRGSGQVTITHYTVRYFKTTDVAGSAQYTTLGVPAHHYDGNEKIVGTYYGETLYEKSYIQQLNNGETQISISDLNANYAFIESGFYDIGVTKLALNEIIDINSRLYTYTHINTGSQYLNIDCKNAVSATSTIHITIRYTKTS